MEVKNTKTLYKHIGDACNILSPRTAEARILTYILYLCTKVAVQIIFNPGVFTYYFYFTD